MINQNKLTRKWNKNFIYYDSYDYGTEEKTSDELKMKR